MYFHLYQVSEHFEYSMESSETVEIPVSLLVKLCLEATWMVLKTESSNTHLLTLCLHH